MLKKIFKENGLKYIPKNRKTVSSRINNTNIETLENMRNISKLNSHSKNKNSPKKYIIRSYKSTDNYKNEKKNNRHSASPIYRKLLDKYFIINNSGKKELSKRNEKLIFKKKEFNKFYSSSTSKEYKPLSIKSKFESYNDMDKLSFERFKKYNSIFEKIKEQIYDINQACKSIGTTTCVGPGSSSLFDNVNSNSKNINNLEIKNNILNISNDLINLNNNIKEDFKQKNNNDSKSLEEKEMFENNINVYNNNIVPNNKNSFKGLIKENSDLSNNKSPFPKNVENQNDKLTILKKSISTNKIQEIDLNKKEGKIIRKKFLTINNDIDNNNNNNNEIAIINNQNQNDKKIIKNQYEKRNTAHIQFINNKNKFNKQKINKNLNITKGTNVFYEGESDCRCENCFIF